MNDFRNIFTIAKKEFMDNWRNKWVLSLSIIFFVLMLVISYFGNQGSAAGWRNVEDTIFLMSRLILFLIPIISLMIGYATIVGEREKGSLNIVLSYPVTRDEIIIGKFIGLGSVVSLAILLGFGIAGGIIGFKTGGIKAGIYSIFLLSSILLGLSYLALAMLLSTLFDKKSGALAGAIFVWFFFAMIFSIILFGIMFTSGENFVKTIDKTSVNVYGNGKLFEVDGTSYSIAYGDGNIFISMENKILKYNVITHSTAKTKLPAESGSISYSNGRIYMAGEKAWIYDINARKWNSINISCYDVYSTGDKAYFLKNSSVIEYNVTNGKRREIFLPESNPVSITGGNGKIYVAMGEKIYEYENGWKYIANASGIIDMTYGNGKIFALSPSSIYEINVSEKKVNEKWIKGLSHGIAYGDGNIYLLSYSTAHLISYPSWYYIADFFNPNEIYGGITSINLNRTVLGMEIAYPEFYNIYSLFSILIAWIVIPLTLSIYIFRRKDI